MADHTQPAELEGKVTHLQDEHAQLCHCFVSNFLLCESAPTHSGKS
jgi:hypothetical protein